MLDATEAGAPSPLEALEMLSRCEYWCSEALLSLAPDAHIWPSTLLGEEICRGGADPESGGCKYESVDAPRGAFRTNEGVLPT